MSHTLIPNPDPKIRILLHRDAGGARFVTVESLDHDAIGCPQWEIGDDSRTEKIRKSAALALIEHAKPSALRSDAPVALGTCEHDASMYRCSVRREDNGALVLVTERDDHDMAGMTRWNVHDTSTLTSTTGERIMGLVDADALIDCLFRD